VAKAGPAVRIDIYATLLVITAIVYVLGIVCGSFFLDEHYLRRFAVRRRPARAVTPRTVERETERPVEAPKEAPDAGKKAAPKTGEGDLDIDDL